MTIVKKEILLRKMGMEFGSRDKKNLQKFSRHDLMYHHESVRLCVFLLCRKLFVHLGTDLSHLTRVL